MQSIHENGSLIQACFWKFSNGVILAGIPQLHHHIYDKMAATPSLTSELTETMQLRTLAAGSHCVLPAQPIQRWAKFISIHHVGSASFGEHR